ncbi:hypothetical protein EDD22DRAFT_1014880 [Suillus occidentalis]|nr:hypothetical protein EDD22DRAFT_1014880 [Suillus occidentalis]
MLSNGHLISGLHGVCSSCPHSGESFTPTTGKGDDHGIIYVIDTGPPAPGSAVPNGTRATKHNPLRPATVLMPWRRRTTIPFLNNRKFAIVTWKSRPLFEITRNNFLARLPRYLSKKPPPSITDIQFDTIGKPLICLAAFLHLIRTKCPFVLPASSIPSGHSYPSSKFVKAS